MSDVKYCPECNTEYYAHIIDCADCEVPLKSSEEMKELQERQKQFEEEEIPEDAVIIKRDQKNWILELHNMLIDNGYSCRVTASTDCSPGKCDSFLLVVPKGEAEAALRRLNEYHQKMHPELKVSEELSSQGKCPACGFDAGFDTMECPDCGLPLIIESDEET